MTIEPASGFLNQAAVAPPPVTGVNCIGDITASIGLGTAARQMLHTILDEGIPASFLEREIPSPARESDALREIAALPTTLDYPTNLLFFNVNDLHLLPNAELARLTGGKYTIARWFWELSQLPAKWAGQIDRVDEIWVSSRFTQACFQAVTNKPVIVIPVTVEVPVSPDISRARFDLPEDRFIFLFTFAANSIEARKNPFAVIKAFERAFGRPTGQGSPYLVIKAHYVDEWPDLRAALTRALDRVGGTLIVENFSRHEANDLLQCADCYVSLHRAEGFGLGPAESMYLGKPVIATNYSGNVDFMTTENSYPVNFRERAIRPRDHHYNPWGSLVYQPGMVWAEPDIKHAAAQMRRVFEQPAERAARGARAAHDMRARFSHAAVGRLIRQRLAAIEREQPLPTKRLDVVTSAAGTPILTTYQLDSSLQQHHQSIGSLEWSRTRDKHVPFQHVKGLGTVLRMLARVVVQGRINERQQWINTAAYNEITTLAHQVAELREQVTAAHERAQDDQANLLSFMLRYFDVIKQVEGRVPDLADCRVMTLSEDDGGRLKLLARALPRWQEGNTAAHASDQELSARAPATRQHGRRVWYHAGRPAHAAQSDGQVLHQVRTLMDEQDTLVLLARADDPTPVDSTLFQTIFDDLLTAAPACSYRVVVVRCVG